MGGHGPKVAEIDVEGPESCDDDEVRQDESPTPGPGAPEAATQVGDIDADLNGKRSRQGLANRDRLAHLLLGEPFAVVDQLTTLHLADQGNRAAKAKKSKAEEIAHQLADPAAWNGRCRRRHPRPPPVVTVAIDCPLPPHPCGGRSCVIARTAARGADVSFRGYIVRTASPRCPNGSPPYRCRHNARPPRRSPCDRRARTYRAPAPAGRPPVSWCGQPPID